MPDVVTRFYTAFAAKDAAGMAACYAPDATFSDPVFQGLKGVEVIGMWAMLCHRGKDLELTFRDVECSETAGRAHWDARYTFSATGRRVDNHIDAEMTLKDGLIAAHVDTFDLYAWTKMALGAPGLLLGWTPLLQNKVRGQARAGLDAWLRKHPEGLMNAAESAPN